MFCLIIHFHQFLSTKTWHDYVKNWHSQRTHNYAAWYGAFLDSFSFSFGFTARLLPGLVLLLWPAQTISPNGRQAKNKDTNIKQPQIQFNLWRRLNQSWEEGEQWSKELQLLSTCARCVIWLLTANMQGLPLDLLPSSG